ncbi:MAG: CDP-diacylglycerol--serine O-phosphatidyltransferase [Verrucomicrobiota bacterium]|nr:CDP-diacylglycerol--serine O-phosphatidyltransferase [Verrucomicrobiota bacterium]
MNDPQNPKIYLLPNLMTAGNLFCGFAAVLRIYDGAQDFDFTMASQKFHDAIWFILAACIFDLLDGRLARLGGHDSAFGREFDSLADIVSFGLAPALLVYQIVLGEFHNLGWMIAFVYLACGALRLARFNCVAAAADANGNGNDNPTGHPRPDKSFTGFPIPAAAGVIASITLFLLWLNQGQHTIGRWKYALPFLMLFLSFMMFSKFRYPSFKAVNWRTTQSLPRFLIVIAILALTVKFWQFMVAIDFLLYLLYGFLRPWLSPKRRREIEEEIGEEEPSEEAIEETP